MNLNADAQRALGPRRSRGVGGAGRRAGLHRLAAAAVASALSVALFVGLTAAAAPAHAAVPLPAAVSATGDDPFALTDAALVAAARADLRLTRRLADGLARVLGDLRGHRGLFDRPDGETLTPAEKRLVKSAWGAIFDYIVAIETVRQRWWAFLGEPATGPRHAWGFVVTHHALTAELAFGGQFAALTTAKPALELLLDEPDAAFGVPAGAFAQFKLKVVHVATSTQLLTGDAYLTVAKTLLKRHGVGRDAQSRAAMAAMPLWSKSARDSLFRNAGSLFFKNGLDILRDWTMRGVMPVQKGIAEWMGDTRVRRVGKHHVQASQLPALLAQMQPGDIVLARQNWYLSNLGLPGFWPHAELYLGTPRELAAALDKDPEVRAWVQSLAPHQPTLTAHLAAVHPRAWKAYVSGKDFTGHGPIRVIESISEGVSFTASEHAFLVDYLAVLRPRVSAVIKARAIVRAFGLQGRPYDFDFDFRSDASLVCTELVWKSYAPETEGGPGLHIPLVLVAGRATLPANEIVRVFDAEADKSDRQLDFVGFLDGNEASGKAVSADAAALRASWQRVKWDIAQD